MITLLTPCLSFLSLRLGIALPTVSVENELSAERVNSEKTYSLGGDGFGWLDVSPLEYNECNRDMGSL